MKKQLLLLLMMLSPMIAMAYDAEIDGIYYSFNGTEATVTFGDNKYTGDVVIPGTVNYNNTDYSVTNVGYGAFSYCYGLTSITIPNSVTSIGGYAFYYCHSLTSITLSNSMTVIEDFAFEGCQSLTSITIPNSVTSIGNYAFSSCTRLTSITIPTSVTRIGDCAFSDCGALTAIIVEEGNTTYDSRNNCNALIETSSNRLLTGCMNTTIPNSVTSIEDWAFSGCTGLTSITIPNSVTNIGSYAFNWCGDLTAITVDVGNESYYSDDGVLFNKVNKMLIRYPIAKNNQDYVIPNGVTSIGESAFANCRGLISVTIPKSVTSIGYNAFFACYDLTSITIPNSVTSIAQCAFYLCDGLTSITIPNSVTSIEYSTFFGCNALSSIMIPNSVTTIGDHAFGSCNGLTNVYCYTENVPTTDPNAFSITPISNITLHVLPASVDAYKTTAPWSDFKEIVESDYLDVTDLNIKAGEFNVQEISLNNGLTDLVAFQMDLTLPDGISIDKTGCSLSDRITDENQELTIGKLESGAYRITSTSFSLTPISGNDGTLLSLKLTAEDGCIGGQATISNIVFSTAESEKVIMSDKTFDISILYNLTYKVDGEEYKTSSVAYGTALTAEEEPTKEGYSFGGWSDIPETMPNHDVEITGRFYLYGDVNTDEDVDVVDIVDIARFVVATPSVSFREKLADLNFDNAVNIADAVTLVNYIAGDQNFARAMESYNYDQCLLQLVNNGTNMLSLCLDGDADFTAFQFEVKLPENTDITAMRINGQRKDDHQILYNKVDENRYRVAVLSLSNAVFKGNEGELLNISIEGQPTNEISVHDILFVTKNGTAITFDDISLSETITGIANVSVNDGNNVIYDLQGRKLSNAQRGVNIVNGKKVVVK